MKNLNTTAITPWWTDVLWRKTVDRVFEEASRKNESRDETLKKLFAIRKEHFAQFELKRSFPGDAVYTKRLL
mgnify:FL=1